MGNARLAALNALEKCRRAGAWSDAVLGSVMENEGLDGRDKALASALCYGVMQNRSFLDYYIDQYATVKTARMEPKVRDILRLSAYQLLLMDRIPASAAVNEGVKLCRSLGYARAAGLVNAVLRRLAENAGSLPAIRAATETQRLSIQYSHPLWLVEDFVDLLGTEEAERLLACHNRTAPVTIQVNTLKTDGPTLAAALEKRGIRAEAHDFLPDCLVLPESGAVAGLPELEQGLFYVQDPAARLSVLAAEPKPGQKILDCCAAPGGKSFAAAISSGGQAAITACDIHENKLKRLREGAERLGISSISTCAADGRKFRPEWEGAFDLVIADVPCSGLGVIRKKPDIRYKDPAAFAALPDLQLAILQNVSRYVKTGGTLVYSTCTVREEENRAVVERFLKENSGFAAQDFTLPGALRSENGMLQLWPQRQGTDGFFFAKLRRCQ
ncbi:MAG: 16S rRNA (cytosine(967)-C(5))-methyltransferase RsmB [Oscillospiraceae bacterium]